MLEIAICDDEKFVAANIEKMLMDLSASSSILLEIDVFFDGSTLVDYIKSGKCYDIIYLDIEMAVQNGVDAAREIRGDGWLGYNRLFESNVRKTHLE